MPSSKWSNIIQIYLITDGKGGRCKVYIDDDRALIFLFLILICNRSILPAYSVLGVSLTHIDISTKGRYISELEHWVPVFSSWYSANGIAINLYEFAWCQWTATNYLKCLLTKVLSTHLYQSSTTMHAVLPGPYRQDIAAVVLGYPTDI